MDSNGGFVKIMKQPKKKERIVKNKPRNEVDKWSAWNKPESTYDDAKSEFRFKVWESGTEPSFRLVHDDVKILALFYEGGKGVTSTTHKLWEGETLEKVEEEIHELGLPYDQTNWDPDFQGYDEKNGVEIGSR